MLCLYFGASWIIYLNNHFILRSFFVLWTAIVWACDCKSILVLQTISFEANALPPQYATIFTCALNALSVLKDSCFKLLHCMTLPRVRAVVVYEVKKIFPYSSHKQSPAYEKLSLIRWKWSSTFAFEILGTTSRFKVFNIHTGPQFCQHQKKNYITMLWTILLKVVINVLKSKICL